MRLPYDIVDVFTDRPFAGNQLAVVHGADDLTTEQCLAIAREFNFSETTFPAARVTDGREYATRIFTPGGEIPFAGHPTLGTASVLRSRGLLTSDATTQHCGAGRVGVRFGGDGGGGDAGDDMVELSAVPRDLVGPVDASLVSDLLEDLGLSGDDAVGEAWVAGCGLSFVHVRVADDAVVRAVPSSRPFDAFAERLAQIGPMQDLIDAINLYAVSGDAPRLQIHSRVFVPGQGIAEDPATGSAAAGLGMALVATRLLPEGGGYAITQGVEMGRPSSLLGRVEASGGAATLCHVAGRVRPVATGEIAVPPVS
jgi:trans-2,3-dihydro-3-hydroxyanthranilate isomerase